MESSQDLKIDDTIQFHSQIDFNKSKENEEGDLLISSLLDQDLDNQDLKSQPREKQLNSDIVNVID